MGQYKVLNCLIEHAEILGIDKEKSIDIERLNTGKRNDCYCIRADDVVLFCKAFNSELRFASQFDKSRYYVEVNALRFLAKHNCNVPKIKLLDDEEEIMFQEYIQGKTLKQEIIEEPDKESFLIRKTLEEISKVHRIVIRDEDFPDIKFKFMEKSDYYKSMGKTICLLYDFLGIRTDRFQNVYKDGLSSIAKELAEEQLRYGHFELHSDNIMFDGKNIHLIDFEKFYPHIPQLDLISLLMNGNINKNSIQEYIKYYMSLNNIKSQERFLYLLDCANIFYNLKIIDMIIRNSLGYETKWEEIDGKRVKKVEKTNSNFGIKWNIERNENLEKRIKNILDFEFYQDSEIIGLKNYLFAELLEKIEDKNGEER